MSTLGTAFRNTLSALALATSLLAGGAAYAADIDVNADVNDIAVHGYDPVAYFKVGRPTPGAALHTATYKGAIYQFVSAENRDAFRAAPEEYAPQFGGHCALGVALNKKLDIDPNAWRIVDGKLYLNVNKEVQAKWVQDIPGHLRTANEVWPEIRETPAGEL